MSYVCLWSPTWSTAAAPSAEPRRRGGDVALPLGPGLAAALLELAPRVALEPARGLLWADARGLATPAAPAALAHALLARVAALGTPDARAGVARRPAAAEAAARSAEPGTVAALAPEEEEETLARLPLERLEPDPTLLALLQAVGLHTCGELARLDAEAVEVRFGPAGHALWLRARGTAPAPRFPPAPPERPHASLDFLDYTLTDPARLLFAANALLGSICDTLRARGEHARVLLLQLGLADGSTWRRVLRAARPTASRAVWRRRVRAELERAALPDAVAAIALRVEAAEPAGARQGDLFDPGFGTAEAVEAALARLIDAYGPVAVAPESCADPRPERRTGWRALGPEEAALARGAAGPAAAVPARAAAPRLSLQLLPAPEPVRVETVVRRGAPVPVRYRDRRGWHALLFAAGPDRISGGAWEAEPYAREYFRCLTADGALVWLFRDARTDAWYLHGWWD